MPPIAKPEDLLRTNLAAWRLMAEAQSVIAMRMMGVAGLWPVAANETTRMVQEKPAALAEAAMAAARAAMMGQRPDQVLQAWMRPISKRTRSNTRRLSKLTRG